MLEIKLELWIEQEFWNTLHNVFKNFLNRPTYICFGLG